MQKTQNLLYNNFRDPPIKTIWYFNDISGDNLLKKIDILDCLESVLEDTINNFFGRFQTNTFVWLIDLFL